jgi:general secretion pathway protein G
VNSLLVRKPSFSLVELVIVVVIVGVIAAIAIPRISRGAAGATDVAVRGDISALRSAIDLYAAEHGGQWPGADGKDTTFVAVLTSKTDSAGKVGTAPGIHIYGPYLRSIPELPVGPYAGSKGIDMQTSSPLKQNEGAGLGWVYNYETGEMIANTGDLDSQLVGYDSY